MDVRDAGDVRRLDCGRCHACGSALYRLVDGSELCTPATGGCARIWRLFVHGWRGDVSTGDLGDCREAHAARQAAATRRLVS